MNILLKVDQTKALRSGINAPDSTIRLDINPADLSQEERNVLAAIIIDGHDATHLGLRTDAAEITAQKYSQNGSVISPYSNGDPTAPLLLVKPDIEGLREAIACMIEERQAKRKETQECQLKKQALAHDAMLALMQETSERREIGLDINGEETLYGAVWHVGYEHIPTYIARNSSDLSPDDRERFAAWKKEADEKNEESRKAAIRSAAQELDRLSAERQAKKKEADEEKAALLFCIPEPTRTRIAAGYGKEGEEKAWIRKLAMEDAGLANIHDPYTDGSLLEELSDEEFASLQSIKTEIGKRLSGATVLPYAVADKEGYWRKADEDDDPEDVDSDGEVWVAAENERRRVVIAWTVADCPVCVAVPFTVDLSLG